MVTVHRATPHFKSIRPNIHLIPRYGQQRDAIVKRCARMFLTTGAHALLIVVPETFNVAKYSTAGTSVEFLRAYAAMCRVIKGAKSTRVIMAIDEVFKRFDQSAEKSEHGRLMSLLVHLLRM